MRTWFSAEAPAAAQTKAKTPELWSFAAAPTPRGAGKELIRQPPERTVCGWDREFESPLLQRGGSCELNFLEATANLASRAA